MSSGKLGRPRSLLHFIHQMINQAMCSRFIRNEKVTVEKNTLKMVEHRLMWRADELPWFPALTLTLCLFAD